ncbi:MAG: hypothetical protein KGI26_00640 [Thaumarchaeota archaeon]|nr:hypothetical protein [Nitrososphaerota archaeon]
MQFLPLMAAAALVGILHMSAPDHWMTVCVMGQKANWSRPRLLWFGAVTAGGHALLSVLLGFGVVFVGLVFSQALSGYITIATGAVMVVVGLVYGVKTLLSEDGGAHEGEGAHDRNPKPQDKGAAYFAVLGGALSPDLSILPIFLIASQVALGLVIDTAVVFAVASVLSLLVLVTVGSLGVAKIMSRIPPKYNDSLVGFVIAAVGAYVLVFG